MESRPENNRLTGDHEVEAEGRYRNPEPSGPDIKELQQVSDGVRDDAQDAGQQHSPEVKAMIALESEEDENDEFDGIIDGQSDEGNNDDLDGGIIAFVASYESIGRLREVGPHSEAERTGLVQLRDP